MGGGYCQITDSSDSTRETKSERKGFMGTRIETHSKDAARPIVLGSPLAQAESKPPHNVASTDFLADRFENCDSAELAQFSVTSQNTADDGTTVKAFDLMLDEKSQLGGEFMISSPTGSVALWWGDLADLINLLPSESSVQVIPLDTQTREILMSVCESAPHRRFTAVERRD